MDRAELPCSFSSDCLFFTYDTWELWELKIWQCLVLSSQRKDIDFRMGYLVTPFKHLSAYFSIFPGFTVNINFYFSETIAGSHGHCLFRFLRNCQSVSQSGCIILHSLQQCVSNPVSPHPYQPLVCLLIFLIIEILVDVYL